jgi:hypothetical protein
MKCPHCDQDIQGKSCPQCGEDNLEEAGYCMACGSPLNPDRSSSSENAPSSSEDEDFDFENRVLCPDGACTGIMVDGKCTECSRSFEEAKEEPPEESEGE